MFACVVGLVIDGDNVRHHRPGSHPPIMSSTLLDQGTR
jgi:hypothetical protein